MIFSEQIQLRCIFYAYFPFKLIGMQILIYVGILSRVQIITILFAHYYQHSDLENRNNIKKIVKISFQWYNF